MKIGGVGYAQRMFGGYLMEKTLCTKGEAKGNLLANTSECPLSWVL